MTAEIDEASFGKLRRQRKADVAVLAVTAESEQGTDPGLNMHGEFEYPQVFDSTSRTTREAVKSARAS
ncbi:MAG TPA: hypothetical protein VI386_25405 [Candidatus Sulfotelmatobacter sp.]